MGQWWQVINVDQREASKHPWGELGAWFFYPHEHLLNYLSIPCLPKQVDQWLSSGPMHLPLGPISKLPVEAIDLIFEQIRELHEVIHLSITCKLLLAIGKRHILRATKEYYAPWVGCRLISLGDDTPLLDDLPTGLLTPAERAEIERTPLPNVGTLDAEYERNLSNHANAMYERVFHMDWRMQRVNHACRLAHTLQNWRILPSPGDAAFVDATMRDVKMFTTLYGDGRRATYPDGKRVLCNLSKGEYVRDGGLTVPNYANLAHALLARICWSSSPEVGMVCEERYKMQLTGGSWAGDRFCVTTLDLLPETEAKRAWRDVTDEVNELLIHIWENNSRRWIVFCKK